MVPLTEGDEHKPSSLQQNAMQQTLFSTWLTQGAAVLLLLCPPPATYSRPQSHLDADTQSALNCLQVLACLLLWLRPLNSCTALAAVGSKLIAGAICLTLEADTR